MLALEFKSIFIFEYLLEQGADVNALDKKRHSVLHYALQSRDEIFAVNILQTGRCDPAAARVLDEVGQSCYDLAVSKGYTQATQLLQDLLKQADGGVLEHQQPLF